MAAKKTTTKAAPAKKAAKKTATKTAKKAAPAKKAAKKAEKKPAKSASFDEIAAEAYYIYRDRVAKGLPGDPQSDWLAAEKKLGA